MLTVDSFTEFIIEDISSVDADNSSLDAPISSILVFILPIKSLTLFLAVFRLTAMSPISSLLVVFRDLLKSPLLIRSVKANILLILFMNPDVIFLPKITAAIIPRRVKAVIV